MLVFPFLFSSHHFSRPIIAYWLVIKSAVRLLFERYPTGIHMDSVSFTMPIGIGTERRKRVRVCFKIRQHKGGACCCAKYWRRSLCRCAQYYHRISYLLHTNINSRWGDNHALPIMVEVNRRTIKFVNRAAAFKR